VAAPVCMLWSSEILNPSENQTTVPWTSSLKPSHYTDYTIPYP